MSIFSMSFVGCAYNFNIFSQNNFDDIKIRFTNLIFLKPSAGKNNNVFLNLTNNELIEHQNFTRILGKYLMNKGYNLVGCQEKANYMIQSSIIQLGEISERKFLKKYDQDLLKSIAQCETKYKKNDIFILNEDSYTSKSDKIISIVIDIVISEKYGKKWNHYNTRVISSANSKIANIKKTIFEVLNQIGKSVSELF